MPSIEANGLSFEYETFGDDKHPCVLLIMGLGTQMTAWPVRLCEALVDKGYYVVRYDNRDIGLSTRLDHLPAPDVRRVFLRRLLRLRPRVPYTLDDMTADAIALLDALGIEYAHVVGASMGGMIAQLAAANYPRRILSLTSIMSTTGHWSLPRAESEAMKALMLQPDDPNDKNSVLARNLKVRRVMQSPAYAKSDEELHATVLAALERGGYHPAGVARQLGAILASKDHRSVLQSVSQPALVIHGEHDPLVKLACGEDTAKHLPNGELVTFPGMGHDLPEQLCPEWAELIHKTAQRAAA